MKISQHSHRSISRNVSQQKTSKNYQQISQQRISQKKLSSSNYNPDIIFVVLLQIASINKSNNYSFSNSQNQVSTRQNITSLPISRLYINNKSYFYCQFVVYSNIYHNIVGFVPLAHTM